MHAAHLAFSCASFAYALALAFAYAHALILALVLALAFAFALAVIVRLKTVDALATAAALATAVALATVKHRLSVGRYGEAQSIGELQCTKCLLRHWSVEHARPPADWREGRKTNDEETRR